MSSIVKAIAGAAAIVVGAVTGQAWLIGIGVSLEIGALTPKPKDAPIGGSADQVSYDPTEPRKLAVGYAVSQGSFVDEFSHDYLPWGGGNQGKNRVTEFVRALFDYECDSLYQVWNGTTLLTLGVEDATLGYPVQEYISGGHCHLYIKFYRGTWTQTADAHLISVGGGRYSSTDKGVGVCYVRITMVSALDSKDQVWAGGEPNLKFVVKGARLYNPAKDSSVGGSGSHRFGDSSTYEWSDNEPLIRYNVIRGFYLGNGKLFYGVGASHDETRFDDAVAAIATADEDVALKAGGTQKRYRAGGTIEVSVAPRDTIKALAEASAGRTVTVAGCYRIFVGAYNAPVLSFTDADCLPQADYEDEPKRPGDSLVNAVYGSYTEMAEGFVTKSLPVRRSSSDITEDGPIGERSLTLQPGFIQDFYQGQRVMEIMRRRARSQIRATRTLRPIYYESEPGDGLAWTSDRLGYSDKSFYLDSQSIDQKINVTVNLVEDGSTIYDWDRDTDELPISGGDLDSGDPPAIGVPSGVVATPATLAGSSGRSAPTLQVAFDDPLDAAVTGFEVEYRLHGTTASQFAQVANVTGGLINLPNLIGAAEYDFRYRFIAVAGRDAPWSDWDTFTAPDVRLAAPDFADFTIDLTRLVEPVQDLINKIEPVEAIADNSQALIRDLQVQVNKAGESILSLAALTNDQALRLGATIAYQNTEINTRMVQGLEAEASARRDLAVIVYGISTGFGDTLPVLSARVTTLEDSYASLATGKASASDLAVLDAQINSGPTSLAARVTNAEEAIALLDPDSATATISQTAAAAREHGITLDKIGESLQSIIGMIFNNAQRIAATLAFVTTTITATVTDGQSALARSQAEMGAILQTADATLSGSITTVNQASVDRDAALTTQANTLQSWFGAGIDATTTVASKFTSEASTRAAADTALATRATNLEAVLTGYTTTGSVGAAISGESTARAAGDAANAADITTIYSYFGAGIDAVNTAAALITSEASTRASADSAISSSLSSLSTTVSGHTTTLATYGSSIDGLKAQWGVQINVDNAVTGLIRLDSGDTNSNFVVVADNFYYYDPTDGETPMFAISGGVAYFNVPLYAGLINSSTIIASNVIITDHLEGAAVNDTQYYTGLADVHSYTGSGSNSFNATNLKTASKTYRSTSTVQVDFNLIINLLGTAALWTVKCYRHDAGGDTQIDGVYQYRNPGATYPNSGATYYDTLSFVDIAPPAGAAYYYLNWLVGGYTSGHTEADPSTGGYIKCTEVKV